MLEFIKNKFSKWISSLLASGEKDKIVHIVSNESESNKDDSADKQKQLQKIWKKELNPIRQLVLWGWDDQHNPSFLILYGKHHFTSTENSEEGENVNILEPDVKYTSCAVFKGKEGHLPSFKAVQIIEEIRYKNNTKDSTPVMYYKKGVQYNYWWTKDSKYIVKEFQNLEPAHQVTFPYFTPQSHDQYVQKIENQGIHFTGFEMAKNPNEILKLDGQLIEYLEIITDMMSHLSLYTRKKRLNELLTKNPPKEVYTFLLEMGSTEVISGLFLEFARMSNPILIQEAKILFESEIKWAGKRYAKGVKRCAQIYLNALDPELKAARIIWIRKFLRTIDLHLISINGKVFEPDTIIVGSIYRKYALSGLLMDNYQSYDYQKRKYVKSEAPKRYEVGPYTDGRKLKLINFKNTIQESEMYQLADVIGKVAYYLDAPRLTYFFKGSKRTKALNYFRRYIRRIINSYAQNNPGKFMEAMKHFLISYRQYDYVCKFEGNFQFNEFLKYYLYHDFKEKPPIGWDNWSARWDWVSNDQLLRLEGRHEFMKEIWDRHLDVVADIALGAQITQVVKACYYILKDSPNAKEFVVNVTYQKLINLTQVSYEPLAEMFMDILTIKIQQLNTFNAELMLALMGCSDKKMHERAMVFFQRTNGLFSATTIANLLLLDNLEQWVELFRQNLLSLEGDQYADFIKYLISITGEFQKLERPIPENIRDILTLSVNQIQQVSKVQKLEIISGLIAVLLHQPKLPEWIGLFIEEVIFAFQHEDLESLLAEIILEAAENSTSSRNKRIISVLESIRNRKLPSDSQIIDILSAGSSKTVNMLCSIIIQNCEELNNRFVTLLIMLESEVTVLNTKAEEIFDSMPTEKQKKLHGMIIDSPVLKAYTLGLGKLDVIYGDQIPEEFIIQMLEHGSTAVKAYISDKIKKIIDNLGNGNKNLFIYYCKTLLFLPNKISKSKDRVCEVIPQFALKHKDKLGEIESILLDIGGSNTIVDSERALVTLAKIGGGVVSLES